MICPRPNMVLSYPVTSAVVWPSACSAAVVAALMPDSRQTFVIANLSPGRPSCDLGVSIGSMWCVVGGGGEGKGKRERRG